MRSGIELVQRVGRSTADQRASRDHRDQDQFPDRVREMPGHHCRRGRILRVAARGRRQDGQDVLLHSSLDRRKDTLADGVRWRADPSRPDRWLLSTTMTTDATRPEVHAVHDRTPVILRPIGSTRGWIQHSPTATRSPVSWPTSNWPQCRSARCLASRQPGARRRTSAH